MFANAGTDFAPIVEGISRNTGNAKFPKFITVPHENVAMAMAHGYYRTCGKPAAVMVHVTVGTANTICGLMNAARDNVPMLLAAGRTPITETGHIASRNRSIHWGQESFDQGGMVREFVKWDYELRDGQPVDAVVDRALDIAMSEPRGPVYLTLPREVLANPATHSRRDNMRPLGVAAPEPARRVIDEAAAMIAKAEFPLIVTSTIGRDPAAVIELGKLADEFAIPVVQTEARDFNLPTDHPMHLGFEAGPWVKKADVVIVLDCVIPWIPQERRPARATPRSSTSRPIRSPPAIRSRRSRPTCWCGRPVRGAAAAARGARRASARPRTARPTARRKTVAAAREENAAKRKKLIETVKDQSPVHLA